MSTFILKRKSFTLYDETDNLKRMKDSDILAEEKKSTPGYGGVIGGAAKGALVGGGVLAAGSALSKGAGAAMAAKGAGAMGMASAAGGALKAGGAGIAKAGKVGAVVGAGLLAAKALGNRSKQKAQNNAYNDRLEYAQRQAQRRERKDWKSNMTQRDGYSY